MSRYFTAEEQELKARFDKGEPKHHEVPVGSRVWQFKKKDGEEQIWLCKRLHLGPLPQFGHGGIYLRQDGGSELQRFEIVRDNFGQNLKKGLVWLREFVPRPAT